MIYLPTPIEAAAERMVNSAFPLDFTPTRAERVNAFECAQSDLARLSVEEVFNISNNTPPAYTALVPLGVYATRDAIESLVRKDRVDYDLAPVIAEELQTLCTFLKSRMKLNSDGGKTLGFAAELGTANMVWAGIAEGELGLSHSILMGCRGYDKKHDGLKRDIDMVIRANAKGKQGRKNVQIKASSKRARNIYDSDITVITTQDVVGTRTPDEAVAKLLKWDRIEPEIKVGVYRRFESILGVKRPIIQR